MLCNLDESRLRSLGSETIVQKLGKRAVEGVDSSLNDVGSAWPMDKHEQASLGHDVAKAVELLYTESRIRENTQIHGRMNAKLRSQTFNTSGIRMAFLPLERLFP